MNKTMSFDPNWISPPGDTIADILEEQNISTLNFAERIGSDLETVANLLCGNVHINSKLADKLEQSLGVSQEFWLIREEQYRATYERIQEENKSWLKSLPVNFMIKNNWIQNNNDIVKSCLDFFDAPSVRLWRSEYDKKVNSLAFRTSQVFSSDSIATAAWLRQGEIIGQKIDCSPWDKKSFENSLFEIKKLTRLKSPKDFLPKLISICSKSGVAVSIVQTPPGCRASGATKFLSKDKALLMLSFRYLTDDQFWFTFFHEAGHLILHGDKSLNLEIPNDRVIDEKENEANIFAAEVLVPYTYHNDLKNLRSNRRKIISLSLELGVSPGIIIGQMQYLGIIDFKYLNSYKRRYDWEEISQAKNLI